MIKFARLDDAFSEFLELEASPVEFQSLQQDKKRRKRKGAKTIKVIPQYCIAYPYCARFSRH